MILIGMFSIYVITIGLLPGKKLKEVNTIDYLLQSQENTCVLAREIVESYIILGIIIHELTQVSISYAVRSFHMSTASIKNLHFHIYLK